MNRLDPFNGDDFEARFDKMFEPKNMVKFGAAALAVYLVVALVIIAAIFFGISLVF